MPGLEQIKKLREQTGAGVVDAKKALVEAGDDMEKAIAILQKKGQAKALKKAGRSAEQGIIETYIHTGARVGVMLELNTETDFVARNEKFKELAHEIALQIAATDPKVVKPEDLKEDAEKTDALLAQPSIKNPEETVADLITRYVTHLGENIQVGRFVRYEVGQE
jgi:elongation factor Ts